MLETAEYRVYFLSSGAVLSRDIKCAGDDLAVGHATRLFPEGVIELWRGNRLVPRVESVTIVKDRPKRDLPSG